MLSFSATMQNSSTRVLVPRSRPPPSSVVRRMRNTDNGAPFFAWLNSGERLSKYLGAEPVSYEPAPLPPRSTSTRSPPRSIPPLAPAEGPKHELRCYRCWHRCHHLWARRLQQRSHGHPASLSSSVRTQARRLSCAPHRVTRRRRSLVPHQRARTQQRSPHRRRRHPSPHRQNQLRLRLHPLGSQLRLRLRLRLHPLVR